MKHYISVFILIVGFVFCTLPAYSEVIYDNGTPNLGVSYPYSDFDFPQEIGDTFLLQTDKNVITDVHWWGYYSRNNIIPDQDDFTIRIFNLVSGVPEADPTVLNINVGSVQRTDTGDNVLTPSSALFDLYGYFVYIDPVSLTPGTTYLLSIVNNTEGTAGDWSWAKSNNTGSFYGRTDNTDFWSTSSSYDMAFQLTNDISRVPEPSTLLLLGIGLAGVGLFKKKI